MPTPIHQHLQLADEDETAGYPFQMGPDMVDDPNLLLSGPQISQLYPLYQYPAWEDARYEIPQPLYHPMASQTQGGQLYYQHATTPGGAPTAIFFSPFSASSPYMAQHVMRRNPYEPIGYAPKQFQANNGDPSHPTTANMGATMHLMHHHHMQQMQQHAMQQMPDPVAEMQPMPRRESTTRRSSTSTAHHRGVIPPRVGVYEAVYSNVPVYELTCNGVAVMRRQADSYINATHILKVAGIEKGKRTKILEREIHIGIHEKVQGGYGKYQGTWIPLERAREIAHQFQVADLLKDILYLDRSARNADS